jgi:hypothetical protein
LDKTTADFKGHLEQASGEELAAIHTRGQELLQTIDKQVDESSAIRQIKQEVKDLKTKFTFLSDSSVPADVKSKLDSALQQYQAYLKKVGFKGDDDVDVRIGNDVPGAACYYDPTGNAGKPEIFINRDHASEPDLIFLEYARHVLLSERPTILSVASGKGGPNGENWNYYAINSGLARYYACSFHGQPMFGTDGARSNLRTPGRVINSAPDWKWSNVTGAELWGSLCWDVREVLDRDSADALLRETWFSLNENDPSNTLPHNFREQFLVRAEKIENGKFLSALKEILEQRGL